MTTAVDPADRKRLDEGTEAIVDPVGQEQALRRADAHELGVAAERERGLWKPAGAVVREHCEPGDFKCRCHAGGVRDGNDDLLVLDLLGELLGQRRS